MNERFFFSCLCIGMYVFTYVQVSTQECIGSSGAQVTGGYDLPNMDAGN